MSQRKPNLSDPLFAGIVLFQLAVFGIVGNDARDDSLSSSQITTPLFNGGIAQGNKLPNFAAYQESGRRSASLIQSNRTATLIFKDDCTCDDNQIRDWITVALRRREDITVLVPTAPQVLRQMRKGINYSGRLLAVRRGEISNIGLRNYHLPIAVHLAKDGTILTVQDNK